MLWSLDPQAAWLLPADRDSRFPPSCASCAVPGDGAVRVGAVRVREGRVHRGRAGPQGAAGAVLRRHGPARRGGRANAARAGQADARAPGRRDPEAFGENRTQRLDLRVVAATNRPLDAEAAEGRFRKDLLYRLNIVGLTAPPLRERGPDVARLAEHCWKDVAAAAGQPRATLTRETVTALASHSWPGNVRELQNVLANLTVTRPRYVPVGRDALPSAFRRTVAAEPRPTLAEARETSNARWCATPWGGTAARPRRRRAGRRPPGPLEADGRPPDGPVQSVPRRVRVGAVAESAARPANAETATPAPFPEGTIRRKRPRAMGVTEERPLRRETAGCGGVAPTAVLAFAPAVTMLPSTATVATSSADESAAAYVSASPYGSRNTDHDRLTSQVQMSNFFAGGALTTTGSKARTKRGALGLSKFGSIGGLRWKRND